MYHLNSKETCWMISFGQIKPPSLDIKPAYIKRDTPDTRQKFNMRDISIKDKRSIFLGYIDLALKENLLRCKDIMDFLLQKEAETGMEMVLRTKTGVVISDRAFRTCVQQQKKLSGVIEKSVKQQIIDMYLDNFSYREIIDTLQCSDRHVRQSLDSIGVSIDKKERRKKRTVKLR
jgi:hypothetical protein